MTRRMFDAVTASEIPAGATLVAGYADGEFENVAAMRARFPRAEVVTIAVAHTTRAMVADIESGDMTPETAVEWARDTMADIANDLLTLYANTSTWPSVVAAFKAAGEPLPQWFAADYDGVAELGPGQIAKQYVDTGGYDESVVADYWPGVDRAPSPPAPPIPPEDIVTPADAELFVQTLMATKVAEPGDPAPDTRTFLQLLAFQDKHYGTLLAQITALSAAVNTLAKGEVTAAEVQAAVAAALKAAGHVVAA